MKPYQELKFTDDFMFCKVMTANPELCRRVLSLILGKQVKRIVMRGTQQTVEITAGAKGIRMDVYLDDEEETVYDLEMQTTSKPYLPKRLRYYQSMLDLNHLERGEDYSELPHTVILFICTFDYFGRRLPVYTFENRCVQLPELGMGDASEKVFVNPESRRKGLDPQLNEFLDYLQGRVSAGGLVGEIEEAVERARKHAEWEIEYMTWQAFEMDARREGRAEGIRQGRVKGIIKSGRRHFFSDEVIIEDLMAELGCAYVEAVELLEEFDTEPKAESVFECEQSEK